MALHNVAHILHSGGAKGLDGRIDNNGYFFGGKGGKIGAQNGHFAFLDFGQIDPARCAELLNGTPGAA